MTNLSKITLTEANAQASRDPMDIMFTNSCKSNKRASNAVKIRHTIQETILQETCISDKIINNDIKQKRNSLIIINNGNNTIVVMINSRHKQSTMICFGDKIIQIMYQSNG